ncbi:Protein unc13 -like protein Dlike, partial [Caligus rogercresseyi]
FDLLHSIFLFTARAFTVERDFSESPSRSWLNMRSGEANGCRDGSGTMACLCSHHCDLPLTTGS